MDEPGAIHHVMIRGVERRSIFLSEQDRGVFVDRFERLVVELGFACDALTLIANHVHAVIQTGQTPLASLMHRLGGFHAQRFNRENARAGHLFEGRYKAKRVAEPDGLARVVAYVIGNPVRHRLIPLQALPDDPWSPFSALAGTRPPRRFESAHRIAAILGAVDSPDWLREVALGPDAAAAALEPDLLEELESMIRATCTRHGVPRDALGSRENRSVRRKLLDHGVSVLRLPVTRVSQALGVSRACATRTLTGRR